MKHLIQKILKSLSLKKKKKGFSLIELMIVLAIIGFLTAMAVPNFLRFQLKAKQSEAKAQLGALYMAQKAFFAEWNTYYSDFRDIGYSPEGNLTYRILAGDATTNLLPVPNYTYAGGACSTSTTAGGTMVFSCTSDEHNTEEYCGGSGDCTELMTVHTPAMASTIAQNSFLATAGADLDNDGSDQDEWSINQRKQLNNDQSDL